MLDGILLERAGVPAVAIITEPFHATGIAMAQSWGVPAYRFLEMPHPIGRLTPDEVKAAARRLVEPVVDLLLTGQQG